MLGARGGEFNAKAQRRGETGSDGAIIVLCRRDAADGRNLKMGAPKRYYDHRTGQMKPTGQGKLEPLGSSNPPAPNARGKLGWFGKMAAAIFGKRGRRPR